MKTCSNCGLPAPGSTTSCAYCASEFPLTQTATFSLQASQERYVWMSHSGAIAEAHQEAGLWQVHGANRGERLLTLVAIEVERQIRVALLDSWLRSIATVVVDPVVLARKSSRARREIGYVKNRRDENVLAIFGDGPTGLHLVNRAGEVIALASSFPGRRKGLDVIVTSPEAAPTPVTLGGLLLSVELARAGQLRPVA
jgi:hypothetical protein